MNTGSVAYYDVASYLFYY